MDMDRVLDPDLSLGDRDSRLARTIHFGGPSGRADDPPSLERDACVVPAVSQHLSHDQIWPRGVPGSAETSSGLPVGP
jgi:hypothetical protein